MEAIIQYSTIRNTTHKQKKKDREKPAIGVLREKKAIGGKERGCRK